MSVTASSVLSFITRQLTLLPGKRPLICGINGVQGIGKTTLVNEVTKSLAEQNLTAVRFSPTFEKHTSFDFPSTARCFCLWMTCICRLMSSQSSPRPTQRIHCCDTEEMLEPTLSISAPKLWKPSVPHTRALRQERGVVRQTLEVGKIQHNLEEKGNKAERSPLEQIWVSRCHDLTSQPMEGAVIECPKSSGRWQSPPSM